MASKSKRRRKVLGASCILAALIIAGSSFAWFTSKDEVTNRLSASANYGVSIAEDFTPPENWVPGQTIDKNVGVVNTGNVDAFVRAWLEGEMRIVTEKDNLTTYSSKNMKDNDTTPAVLLDSAYTTTTMLSTYSTPGRLTPTTDQTFKDLDLNYSYVVGTTTYLLRELNKTDLLMNSATTNHSAASPDAYTGVMGVQAGGKLAFAEDDSEFYFTPNQAISITNNETSPITYNIAAGAPIKVKYDENASISITESSGTYTINSLDVLEGVDTNTFAPATTGLYVFERNKALDANGDDYEFSGYYYIKSGNENGTAANQGTYFALHNDVTDNRSDNVLPDTAYSIVKNADGSITFTPTKSYVSVQLSTDTSAQTYTQVGSDWYDRYGVQVTNATDLGTLSSQPKTSGSVSLFTAQQETKKNTDLDWTWTDATETTPAMLSAFYDVDNDYTADVDEVKVNIALSNLYGTSKYPASGSNSGSYTDIVKGNNWTALGTTAAEKTFYYNDDLEEGATTAKLVDSVTLDSGVTKDAYLAFDFDLNVKMDSVQVTYDDNGNETVTAAQATFTSGAPTSISSTNGVTNGNSANEAGALTWTPAP